MPHIRLYYHLVFRTKYRKNTITEEYEKELYAYILGFCKNKDIKLLRINGMPNHLHLLFGTRATFTVSDFVRDLKRATNKMMSGNPHFPLFEGWGEEYSCDTVSFHEVEHIKNYIKGQKEHHKVVSFEDELKKIFGIE